MRKFWKIAGVAFGLLANTSLAWAQSATLLPNAVQTFVDNNGKPLANGNVFFYVPSTTTPKTTWTSAGESVPQANPVPLGIAGRPANAIYGDGIYRQIVKDQFNNVIWDALTSSTGGGSGSSPGPTVGDGNIVGTILPWAGLVAPPNYVFAYGQAISRTTYPLYTSTVTITTNLICTNGLNVLSGIADTSQIHIGTPVEASCIPPGTTVTAVASTSVTVSANASISTAVSAQFFPYGNGDGATTLNVPDFRGRTLAGRDNMGGTAAGTLTQTYYGANTSPDALGSAGGSQSLTFALVLANLPPYTPAGTIANGAITINNQSILRNAAADNNNNGGGGGLFSAMSSTPPGLTASQATSSFTGTAQGGTSTPIVTSLVQPTITTNYVIKVLPDTSSSVATGVASLGGMTGVIACGSNVTCNSQTISFVPPTSLEVTVTNPTLTVPDLPFDQTGSTSNQVGFASTVTWQSPASLVGHSVVGYTILTATAPGAGSSYGGEFGSYTKIGTVDTGGILGVINNDVAVANSVGSGVWGLVRNYSQGTTSVDAVRGTSEANASSNIRTYFYGSASMANTNAALTGIYLQQAVNVGFQMGGPLNQSGSQGLGITNPTYPFAFWDSTSAYTLPTWNVNSTGNEVATSHTSFIAGNSAKIVLKRADGTLLSPTTLQNGEVVGELQAIGYDGSSVLAVRSRYQR